MSTDDQDVEAWYLEGWCFYLMAEKAKETGGTLDELTWEELAKDSRDCLETCQVVRTGLDIPSFPLLTELCSCTKTRSTLTNLFWSTFKS